MAHIPMMGAGSLAFQKLDGSNYLPWSERMKCCLIKEGLWNSTKALPARDDEEATEADEKSRASIILGVTDSILPFLRGKAHAKDCWDTLKNIYQRDSAGSKMLLTRKLYNLKLISGGDLQAHLQELMSIFGDLSERGKDFEEVDKAFILLSSLPSEYLPLYDSLSAMPESQLTLSFLAHRLHDWKSHRAFTSNEKMVQEGDVKQNNVCAVRNLCFRCGKSGHIARNCRNPPQKRNKKKQQGADDHMSKARVQKDNVCLVTTSSNRNLKPIRWLVDSGSSEHLTNLSEVINNARSPPVNEIRLADGQPTEVKSQGTVCLSKLKKPLNSVLYAPNLDYSILSVSRLTEQGYTVTFKGKECIISDDEGVHLKVMKNNKLYTFEEGTANENCNAVNVPFHSDCFHQLHRVLGHASFEVLRKTADICNLDVKKCNKYLDCSVCNKIKLKRFPIPKTSTRQSKGILELVHCDLAGPFPASLGGATYLLVIVDDFSRYTFSYLLHAKNEVYSKFLAWLNLMETQFPQSKVKMLQTDRGGEFINHKMNALLTDRGIIHRKTNPACSAENGIAERKIAVVESMSKCMLEDSNMSQGFWGEAVLTATHVLNRIWSSAIEDTPYTRFYGKKPNLKYMRTFGSYAHVLIPREQRSKRGEATRRLRFLGYDPFCKGYRFWVGHGKIMISRSAKFEQNTNWEHIHANSEVFIPIVNNRIKKEHTEISTQTHTETARRQPVKIKREPEEFNVSDFNSVNPSLPGKRPLDTTSSDESSSEDTESSSDDGEEGHTVDAGPRRSARSTKGIPPKRFQVSHISKEGDSWVEPQSYTDMQKRPKQERDLWLQAMEREFKSLQDLEVLKQVNPPKDSKVIGCKWVFKRKVQSNGEHLYKARLVALGYAQTYLENYDEVYAPTVKPESIRLALTIGTQRNCVFRHLDVQTAYLHAPLEHPVFMKAIPGFESDTDTGVYKLEKSLYGLKQSARNWNHCLHEVLTKMQFTRSSADACLYTRGSGDKQVMILIFVDDVLVVAQNEEIVQNIYRALSKHFTLKDLGEANCYLGVQITRTPHGLELSQKKKVQQLLTQMRLANAKPIKTPMALDFLKQERGDTFQNAGIYRSAIGSLLYLANWTRPDIAYAVGILSRRVQDPTFTDWVAVKRVLRYLKGTLDTTLKIHPTDSNELSTYSDSSFADNEGKRSCTGFVIQYANSPISWKSRKQNAVSLSTAEAEFCALSETCTELQWIQKLLTDIGTHCKKPMKVFVDSQTCIEMAKMENMKSRTKYIGVRYENVRKLIQDNTITLEYVNTENIADIFTKALSQAKHTTLAGSLGINDHTVHHT